MILVICGTNRRDSNSNIVAKYCYDYLKKHHDDVKYLSLVDLPLDFINPEMYDGAKVHPEISKMQDEYIFPSKKWLIISPEYNGSYSGILKLFIDAISVRKYANNFEDKKVGMIGVASGRAGNLRGMDDMTGFLHYLKMHVYPNKLPLSGIATLLDKEGGLKETTKELIDSMLEEYIEW
jgi:NAD(P)H-dependent FMN reductase